MPKDTSWQSGEREESRTTNHGNHGMAVVFYKEQNKAETLAWEKITNANTNAKKFKKKAQPIEIAS